MLSRLKRGDVVWWGKPWVVLAAVIRTITVFVFLVIFVWLEIFFSVAFSHLVILPVFAWTILAFIVIWLISMLEQLIFRASHTYNLRQNGSEIRNDIIKLRSFVVTPAGFGDLLVYQSIFGRIFGYGDITVNSQGERQTKLQLVHALFVVAVTMRDIMGNPIVRAESHV